MGNVSFGSGGDAQGDILAGIANLYGSAFDDTLDGGTGRDTLIGGTGADEFVMASPLNRVTNVDRILDFGTGDKIVLDNSIFVGVDVGALDADAFRDLADGNRDRSDRIVYNSESGSLSFDMDGSKAEFPMVTFAVIANHAELTVADFFVI